MIDMTVNYTTAKILEEKDFKYQLDLWFDQTFAEYLYRRYGITEEHFEQILKAAGPEHFV